MRPDVPSLLAEPRNATEKTLVKIWSALLHDDRVGIHDDFFNLGGHSLLAIRMVSQVLNTFKIEVPLRSFFDLPTVAHLAELISRKQEKVGTKDLANMVTDLESLSDEEALKLLERDRKK